MIEISQTRVRRRDRRWRWLALAVFVAVFLFVFLAQGSRKEESEVQAASLANFDPGYIISDYQMGNYNSMNEAEIQAWLTSKNSCPNTNYDYYLQLSANANYTWHWENGHFVCLSEELFGDGEVIGSGETAAHIIWQTAQDYHINPQVILVLLQKETGLITDPIPNNGDYRKATGYGCPDTAPCSSQYYGFKNQVRKAAALFRTVLDGGWTNYPLGDNYIQYNPSASCGGSVVNIRSLATSALYRYTPYQPNEGALAAGYGTAYCGAYGNRNFYLYFEDWFGGITDENEELPSTLNKISVDDLHGFYNIYSKVDEQKVMVSDGTNVVVWDEGEEVAQNWYFAYNTETNDYFIKNEMDGSMLSVDGGQILAGNNVLLSSQSGSCDQRWKVFRIENDFIIESACSELVLDVAGASSANGANVQLWTSNNTDAQKWVIKKITNAILDEGDYTIESALSGHRVIDIAGGAENARNGTNIQLWEKNGTNAQKWSLVKNEDNTYTIKNLTTGKVLDVAGGSKNAGANIQLWEGNGSCAQRWYIDKVGDKYTFTSACSELVLDVAGASSANGANVQLWTSNNTDAQKWVIKGFSE